MPAMLIQCPRIFDDLLMIFLQFCLHSSNSFTWQIAQFDQALGCNAFHCFPCLAFGVGGLCPLFQLQRCFADEALSAM